MLLWNGGCHVHEKFSVDAIVRLKAEHPDAVVMAHLECKAPVLAVADVKGSTATMLTYAQQSDKQEFIVATEAGILHELERTCPDKRFYPVPPEMRHGSEAEKRMAPFTTPYWQVMIQRRFPSGRSWRSCGKRRGEAP